MTRSTQKIKTHDITVVAVLAAIASILFMIDFPIFAAVPFYKMDFSNLPVLLAGFAVGPLGGVCTLAIKSIIGLTHSTSGGIGELADFIAGLAMVVPASLVYHHIKSRLGAVLGMALGTLCAIAAGILANVFIMFPAYHITEEALVSMGQKLFPIVNSTWSFALIVTGLFNLIKFAAISVVGYLIYKPLSPILHGRKYSEAKHV